MQRNDSINQWRPMLCATGWSVDCYTVGDIEECRPTLLPLWGTAFYQTLQSGGAYMH